MREKLDELARLHAHRFDDDVALSAWREATIGDAFPAILAYVRGLTAERDEAQSQYKQLTKLCKATEEREREYMAHAANLRGALDAVLELAREWAIESGSAAHPQASVGQRRAEIEAMEALEAHVDAALALTPAQSLGRLKAKALREMARLFMATNKSDLSYYQRDLAARFCKAEADRLEALDGR